MKVVLVCHCHQATAGVLGVSTSMCLHAGIERAKPGPLGLVRNAGRLNLLGTLSLWATEETLEYRLLEGNCHKSDVVAYLDALARQAERTATFTVIVLDNATFHRAKDVQVKRDSWEAQGLYLRYLPSYCPQLNLIEGVWRRLKGFLMPRRYYNSLADLREALLAALALLKAVNLQV